MSNETKAETPEQASLDEADEAEPDPEPEPELDETLQAAGVVLGEEPTEKEEGMARELAACRDELDRVEPLDEDNPLGLDPRVGVKDLCYDRAKPGAKVYVVASLASSVEIYEEVFEDAPALNEYAGNVVTRFSRDDAVLACVYVKDSLTSVDTNLTAYPMPESRLTRFPAEEASMVGEKTVRFARTSLPGEVDHRGPEGEGE